MAKRVLLLLCILLSIYVLQRLVLPLAMGAVFGVLFYPWFERLERYRVKGAWGAGLITIGMTALLLIPSALLVFLGAKSGVEQFQNWREELSNAQLGGMHPLQAWVHSDWVQSWMAKVSRWSPIPPAELTSGVAELAKQIGVKIAGAFSLLVSGLPSLFISMIITVISTYFFLYEGHELASWFRKHSIFDGPKTERILHTFEGVCRSVVLAALISGFAQSAVFTLVYATVGGSNVALVGFLVFVGSFVPLVGAIPVTLGAVIHQAALGNTTIAIVLAVMALVVSVIDNVVRPIVLKGSANLHPLLAFLSVFGGLQAFGFSGIFLGPIIVAMTLSILNIVLDEEPA